jgi:uncharacterized protein YjiK
MHFFIDFIFNNFTSKMKQINLLTTLILCISIFVLGCVNVENRIIDPVLQDYDLQKVPYTLYEPTKIIKLHHDLEEISGLSFYGDNSLVSVEDETGKIYMMNAETGVVERKIKFAKSGDYEGVEVIDGFVFVMESNGTLYSFFLTDRDQVNSKVTKTNFTIKNDLEGLGQYKDKLLIACKASGAVDEYKPKGKAIYTYDYSEINPFLDIIKSKLEDFLKSKDHFKSIKDFDPSAIAQHPVNGDMYILSADNVLVVYDRELRLKEIVKLDNKIYKQPEGLCFSPSGRLYISSEGDEERGELFIFDALPLDNNPLN